MSVNLQIVNQPGTQLTLENSSQAPVTWTVENEHEITLQFQAHQGPAGAQGPAWPSQGVQQASEAAAAQAQASATSASSSLTQVQTLATQVSQNAQSAQTSAAQANTSAAQASGSASQALAIYGSAVSQQAAVTAAQAAASVAAGHAASASSVVQQDLSGINAAALHRSPNAVTALFVYDTSKDSDGGAWTERCQHTSWYNEPINGKWLGAQPSELFARNEGAALGAELVVNGTFDSNTNGWTTSAGTFTSVGGQGVFSSAVTSYAYQSFTTVVGVTYVVEASLVSFSGGAFRGIRKADNFSASVNAVTFLSDTGSTKQYFTATATTTFIIIQLNGTSPTDRVTVDSISIRAVTAQTTQTGDYFQLSTDGRFYRLWKNRLAGVTVNPMDSSGLTLFGDAAATLTVVDDASALAAAGLSSIASNAKVFRLNNTAGTTNAFVRFNNALTMGVDTWSLSAYVRGSGTSVIDVNVGTWSGSGSTVLASAYQRQVSTGVTNTSNNQWRIRVSAGGDLYFIMMQAEVSAVVTPYDSNTSTGSISEVFRGNKRDFPRLAAVVAEGSSVTIYDLTEPGRPMWMRFVRQENEAALIGIRGGYFLGMVSAIQGRLYFTTNSSIAGNGLFVGGWIDFPLDSGTRITLNHASLYRGGISLRNNLTGWFDYFTHGLSVFGFGAVDVAVLPNAPVNPITGLAEPIAAFGGLEGVTLARSPRDFVRSNGVSATSSVEITSAAVFAGRADSALYYAYSPGTLGASFALSTDTNTAAPDFNIGNTNGLLAPTRSELLRRSATAATVQKLKNHESMPERAVTATITNTFNTGHMTGDIRRCYMADVGAGSVAAGPELVTNGDFSNGTTDWSFFGSLTGWNVVGGKAVHTSGTYGSFAKTYAAFPVVIGKQYVLTFTLSDRTVSSIYVYAAGNALTPTPISENKTYSYVFTAIGGGSALAFEANPTFDGAIDNISVKEVVADRSYRAQGANIAGTLTKTQVATAAQLVAYSGWSASNYLREPYSADLDFGTGEWTASAWVNVPTTLPASSYPVIGSNLVTNGTFDADTAGWTAQAATLSWVSGKARFTATSSFGRIGTNITTVVGRSYRVDYDLALLSGSGNFFINARENSTSGNIIGGVTITSSQVGSFVFTATTTTTTIAPMIEPANTVTVDVDNISVREVGPALIADRSHSSGSRISLGITATGLLTAAAFDGTTTRTVTTTAAYNTATWLKARVNYRAGRLSIMVNGVEVAVTNGAPLLTLNNSNAVLTIGNSFALDAAFPGSITLLKFSATVPTSEQATWMYEQEKQMFREAAQVCLPDSGAVLDLTYDDVTDRWIAVSATNESEWSGLVRVSVTPVPAGSYSRVSATSGIQLLARTTANPGVDVTIPAYGLREELVRRSESVAKSNRDLSVFDFDTISFTAALTSGSTSLTASSVTGTPYIGMSIIGTNIPANTVIANINGSTYTLSQAATATASVTVTQSGFDLPVGYTARMVYLSGTQQREGSSRNYVKLFDGFREQIRFNSAVSSSSWVQIHAIQEQS